MMFLQPYSDEAWAMLRIVAGFMFSFHGVQKLFNVLTDHETQLLSQVWFGGVIELVGGVLIMIGLFTRAAAFLCSGMMAVAYFQFHWKFQGGSAFLPGVNQGELAALYCFVFFLLACGGSGKWSVDGGR